MSTSVLAHTSVYNEGMSVLSPEEAASLALHPGALEKYNFTGSTLQTYCRPGNTTDTFIYQIVDIVGWAVWMKGSTPRALAVGPGGKVAQSQAPSREPQPQGAGVLPDALLQVG